MSLEYHVQAFTFDGFLLQETPPTGAALGTIVRELFYLDSSALVKLAVREPESAVLRSFLSQNPSVVSSVIARVEVRRATRRNLPGPTGLSQVRQLMARITQIPLNEHILTLAAELLPDPLRTLDAIHLASALSIQDDLAGMVVYDHRLASAALSQGIEVFAPR